MMLTPEFILQIILALGAPAAVYAGIRADLAAIKTTNEHHKEEIVHAKLSAHEAHQRISGHIEKHHMRRQEDRE